MSADQDKQLMEVLGLRQHNRSGPTIVLLKEANGEERFLPIFIGKAEAISIALAMEEVQPPRPMTHDLMSELLEAAGLELLSVEIVDLQESTFFAEMELAPLSDNGHGDTAKNKNPTPAVGDLADDLADDATDTQPLRISCRPSDALAMAVRLRAPVFVASEVLERAGITPDDDSEEDSADERPEEVIEQFREFIDQVSAEDFEKDS